MSVFVTKLLCDLRDASLVWSRAKHIVNDGLVAFTAGYNLCGLGTICCFEIPAVAPGDEHRRFV